MSSCEPPMEEPGHLPTMKEVNDALDQELIDAVVNAHTGVQLSEAVARTLLVRLGMEFGEADELLADARLCAQQE